jgi:hypothetical protein
MYFADAATGAYWIADVTNGGGAKASAAGIGVSFVAPAEGTMQNFAAIINYNYDWKDQAELFTAENDLTTSLWAWGVSENAWVAQTNIPALTWHSHCNWFGGGGDQVSPDAGAFATGSLAFPAAANGHYILWVWSRSYLYSTGWQASGVSMGAQVQYVSFST